MDHLEAMGRLIDVQVRELERQLKAVAKEKGAEAQEEKTVAAAKELQSLQSQLALLDMQLLTATDRQREVFVDRLTAYTARKAQFEAELAELQRKFGSRGPRLADHAAEAAEPGAEREALIGNVDARMQEADADLDDIVMDLNRGKNIMNEVAVELRRQQERLTKALEEIKDTYSLTKRSKALLKYFQRAMMTDKLLIFFVIMVIIAIIVIIVLKSLGFKGEKESTGTLPAT